VDPTSANTRGGKKRGRGPLAEKEAEVKGCLQGKSSVNKENAIRRGRLASAGANGKDWVSPKEFG